MSEFFSPLYDNGLDTRSNSLITNELFVKDPLTDEYKKVLPGGGGGGDGGEVPYYIDDDEINFGSNRTQINGSTAIVPGSITLKDPSFEVSKNIRINTDNITMDNLDDVVVLNATGITPTKSGVPVTPILWSDIQEKRDYLSSTRLYFNDLANAAVSTMISVAGGYFSKIAPVEMVTGAGTYTSSLVNQARLNYYGLSVIGPTSDTSTYYHRNEIKQNIAGGGQKSFTILDAEKVINQLKDLESSAADIDAAVANSGGGGGPANLPDYIEDYSLDFSNIDPDFATKISGMEITAHVSTLKNSVETARFTPDTLWHYSSLGNIYASYPLIINAANMLDGVEYIKPNKIEFTDGSGISEGILHYRDGEGQLKQNSLLNIAEAGGVLPNFIKGNSIQFDDDSSPGFSRIEQDVIGTNIFSAEEFSGTSTQYGPTKIIRTETHFGGTVKDADVNDVIDVTNKFKDVTVTATQINDVVSGGGGSVPGYIKPNKIEFNDVSSGEQLISLTAATNQQSYIMPTAMRVRLNKNTDIYTDTSAQMYNSFTIYAGGINKYTTIRNKEIQTNDGTGTAKTLNLPNIADAQANYLKPDKIEFADGSGLSQGLLHYVDDSSALQSVSIKDLAESSGGTTYPYLKANSIETVGAQSITHKINSGDSLNRYSLTSNSIHHQSRITVGNSSGRRTEIQPDRIYLYEESGEFSGFYNSHIRYLKGGEVKSLNYDDANKTIDKVNTGYIRPSFWSYRDSSKTFWIGKYEKALETTHNFPSSNIIQFTEHAVRNSGKLLFRMWYNAEPAYSAGEIIKFIFRVQKPTTIPPEGPALVNQYALITAHICDVPRKPLATQYLGALVEVVSVGPSLHGEDVENHAGINFENEYYAYYTLQLRALKTILAGELDFTMMFQFHGYLGDFGSMPASMYVA